MQVQVRGVPLPHPAAPRPPVLLGATQHRETWRQGHHAWGQGGGGRKRARLKARCVGPRQVSNSAAEAQAPPRLLALPAATRVKPPLRGASSASSLRCSQARRARGWGGEASAAGGPTARPAPPAPPPCNTRTRAAPVINHLISALIRRQSLPPPTACAVSSAQPPASPPPERCDAASVRQRSLLLSSPHAHVRRHTTTSRPPSARCALRALPPPPSRRSCCAGGGPTAAGKPRAGRSVVRRRGRRQLHVVVPPHVVVRGRGRRQHGVRRRGRGQPPRRGRAHVPLAGGRVALGVVMQPAGARAAAAPAAAGRGRQRKLQRRGGQRREQRQRPLGRAGDGGRRHALAEALEDGVDVLERRVNVGALLGACSTAACRAAARGAPLVCAWARETGCTCVRVRRAALAAFAPSVRGRVALHTLLMQAPCQDHALLHARCAAQHRHPPAARLPDTLQTPLPLRATYLCCCCCRCCRRPE